MKHLQYLNKFYLKYKWRLLLGILFVTGSNYFGILIPQKIRDALDFVQKEIQHYKGTAPSEQPDLYTALGHTLMIFGITVIAYMILKGLLMFLMRQTIIVTSRLIEYDMRKEIFGHLETMDLSYYKSHMTGDLMARITEDVSKVRNFLGPGILYGINLVTLFSMTIYAMFKANPELAIYTLIPLPILSISIYYVSSLINDKSTIIQQQMSRLTSLSQEVFSGIRVVKSYGKEEEFNKYFADESEEFKAKSLDLARVNAYFYPLMILLINISTLIVLIIGGYKVNSGSITAGNIAEFIIYVNMLTWPVTSIGWIASVVQEAEASQKRINEILDSKSNIVNVSKEAVNIAGKIEFKNVSFTYVDNGIEALKKVSFTILPGEKLAIIGKTASGKSTIAELLMRMYDVSEGEILIDGVNIKELNIFELRKKIGYVPQDVFLFSDKVANNISFGIGETEISKIAEYSKYAAINEEIERLPESYDTMVGERGVTLSGGQKQRISIARALIKDPEIVIMDDSLSAVDTETEHQILSYLNGVLKNKTAIIITHRIVGLNEYDKILVLDCGKIIQYGKHNELIEQDGPYAQMIENSSVLN